MKQLRLFFLICLNLAAATAATAFAQTGPGFGSVQARPSNKNFGSLPVINLGSSDYLYVSFDDLEDRDMQLRYRVIHLNTDGTRSDLREIEYLNGINNTDITSVEYSFNTRTNYVHYAFVYPSKGRTPKVSGAYMFEIFEPSDPGHVLLRIPFMVSENVVNTEIKMKAPTRVEWVRSRQELEVKLALTGGLRLNQASQSLQVYAQQNLYTPGMHRLPLAYETGNEFYYKDRPETVFDGLNDFRNFDTRPIRHSGRGVEFTEIVNGVWHAQLQRQKSREYANYLNDDDINGDYVIKADNTANSDIEAEYVRVHFVLDEKPKPSREIYVIGQFNRWQCTEESRMHYNEGIAAYTLSLLLKQGFYDYLFACKENGEIHIPYLEGNNYETENDYFVYVFYREPGGRYDRLLSVKRFNTHGVTDK